MARRTKAQMIAYVKEEFLRDDKDDEILTSLNETLEWMNTGHDFTELDAECYVTSVTGQEDYKLSDDILEIYHPIKLIEDIGDGQSSSVPMWHWSKEKYDSYMPNPNTSQTPPKGKPIAYCIFRDAILLYPIPDKATYKIEVPHKKAITRLVADSDEHPFRQAWEELIKEGTLERVKRKIGLMDEAREHATNFLYGYYNPQTGERFGGWLKMTETNRANKEPVRVVRPNYF